MTKHAPSQNQDRVRYPLHLFKTKHLTIKVACDPDGPFAALYWSEDDRQMLNEDEFDVRELSEMATAAAGLMEHVRAGGNYAAWRAEQGLLKAPFQVGEVTVTSGAMDALCAEGMLPPREVLDLHRWCTWGDVDRRTRQRNTKALAGRGPLRSLYVLPKTGARIEVVTNDERSRTTISLPTE